MDERLGKSLRKKIDVLNVNSTLDLALTFALLDLQINNDQISWKIKEKR